MLANMQRGVLFELSRSLSSGRKIFRIRSRYSRSSTHSTVLRSRVVKNFTRVHSEALARGSAALRR